MYNPLPERFIWESNSTATDGKQYPDIETHSAQPGLPYENFNKKPNNAKKRPKKAKPTVQRPEKSQTLFAV